MLLGSQVCEGLWEEQFWSFPLDLPYHWGMRRGQTGVQTHPCPQMGHQDGARRVGQTSESTCWALSTREDEIQTRGDGPGVTQWGSVIRVGTDPDV